MRALCRSSAARHRATGRLAGLLLAAAFVLGATMVRAQTTDGAGVPTRPPEAIQARQLSKLPKQIKFVQAEYPKEAAAKGIEADVILVIDINAKGLVEAVGLVQPADPPGMGFDEAAMAAAHQFVFEPAELDGKPIAVQLNYRYRFKLTQRPASAPATQPTSGPASGPASQAASGPAAGPARPPRINFAGLLRERGTRKPLAGLTVTVFRRTEAGPQGFETVSDAQGSFSFYDLDPADWRVLVEPPGYYPFRTTETIVAGQRTNVVYLVERASYNPFDVMVTARRPRKEVSRTVLKAEEIDKIPGGAGDPLLVVQNFAGVARTILASQLIIRGSAPEDSKVFVDGVEVPLIYHFGGLRSALPIGILESIEFYPGNFSPSYGRAVGGIIDVRIKDMKPEKLGGYADVSILDTGVFLKIPLGKKGGLAIGGRRSYIDALIVAAVPSDAPVDLVTAPRYYDFQLLGTYRPTPAHDLRGLFFLSDDRLAVLFKDPARAGTELEGNDLSAQTSFYRSLLTYRYVPSEKFQNELRVAQGRDWIKFQFAQFVLDINYYNVQIRDTVRHRFGKRFALSYGLDLLYGRVDAYANLPQPPKEGEPQGRPDLTNTINVEVQDQDDWSPAFFAEGEIKITDGLLVLPGLRLDYFGRTSRTSLQPRLTTRWQVAKKLTLKGGVGLFVQEPTFDETSPGFGNPDLGLEKALHYSAGVEYRPRPHIILDVTGFYKDLWGVVSRSSELVTDDDGSVRPLIYSNGGEGRVYGMELVARHEFSNKLSGWIAYTLSRAERRDAEATEDRLFDFDQTHILTLIATYLLPRNWQVGTRFRLVSGNPRTPVVGATFNATTDRYDAMYGAPNTARIPMFHQLDLRIDKRWIFKSWMLNAYIDIQNVYNRANPEGMQYNFDFSESKVQQGLPVLTIFGLRGEF